jgi:hypothetical protein
MPLWTIEVFTDPSACADRIGGYLGLEKPALPARSVGAPGFFLDDDVSTLAVGDFDSETGEETGYGNADEGFGDSANGDDPNGDGPNGSDADMSGRDAAGRNAMETASEHTSSPGSDQTGSDETDTDPQDVDQAEAHRAKVAPADHGPADYDAAGAGVGFRSEASQDGLATERKEGLL